MVNRVIILGNLGKDPEVRYTNSQQAVANLRVATSRAWTDKQSGQRKEETEWFDVEVWGKQAEACGEHLAKGRQVFVEGRLRTEKWTDKQSGAERYRTKVVAESVRFIGGRGGGGQRGETPEAPQDDGPDGGSYGPVGGPDSIPFAPFGNV
jgi:single-strand DNA-binding protein